MICIGTISEQWLEVYDVVDRTAQTVVIIQWKLPSSQQLYFFE